MAARRGRAFDVGSARAIGGVLNVALQRSDGEGKTRLVAAAGSSRQVVSDDGVRRLTDASQSKREGSYLVDPASSHMLVSKIKPCKCKYELEYSETANGSLNQLWFI